MKRLILTLPIFLAACEKPVEYVSAAPLVPPQLLAPVPISERKVVTYRDLAVLAAEHRASAEQANAQIASIAKIIGPQ